MQNRYKPEKETDKKNDKKICSGYVASVFVVLFCVCK